jgi:hypothetical protein
MTNAEFFPPIKNGARPTADLARQGVSIRAVSGRVSAANAREQCRQPPNCEGAIAIAPNLSAVELADVPIDWSLGEEGDWNPNAKLKTIKGNRMRGGKRIGAGRKPGSQTKRTRAIAEKAAQEGITPLEVMLRSMREHYDAGRLDNAAAIAKDAAPYMHPRLQSVQHAGSSESPTQVIFKTYYEPLPSKRIASNE